MPIVMVMVSTDFEDDGGDYYAAIIARHILDSL